MAMMHLHRKQVYIAERLLSIVLNLLLFIFLVLEYGREGHRREKKKKRILHLFNNKSRILF